MEGVSSVRGVASPELHSSSGRLCTPFAPGLPPAWPARPAQAGSPQAHQGRRRREGSHRKGGSRRRVRQRERRRGARRSRRRQRERRRSRREGRRSQGLQQAGWGMGRGGDACSGGPANHHPSLRRTFASARTVGNGSTKRQEQVWSPDAPAAKQLTRERQRGRQAGTSAHQGRRGLRRR